MAVTESNESSKKRKLDQEEDENEKPKQALKTINEYQGYSFQKEANPKVPVVSDKLSGPAFFKEFVSQRKPCVLDTLPTLDSGKPIEITRQLLEQVAGDKTIQVERRPDASSNFGQNRTADRQVTLEIKDFLHKLLDDNQGELYYWSTQEDGDDVFNVPCRQLVDQEKIPSNVEMAGNLIMSSCNLWMGSTKKGASSGLHHDYHDNFYLLLKGRKRFRLLSPDCAPHLGTYGTIDRIFSNGRISYVGNETREDGVPLGSLEEEEEEEDDDEEELVLGKGFDYVSDDDEEGDAGFDETKDDFDEIMGEDEGEGDDDKAPAADANKDNDHPDSFSRINPCQTDEKALQEEFPSFASCKQVMVELKAGQALYLPCGWFHEVTSYSSSEGEDKKAAAGEDKSLDNCHMALNYWYHPPDTLDEFDKPYEHDFWEKEEAHRLQEQATKE